MPEDEAPKLESIDTATVEYMTGIVKPWITDKHLGPMLRAISALCDAKYRDGIAGVYGPAVDYESRAFRTTRDIFGAYGCVTLNRDADAFERRIAQAGISDEERDQLARQREIADLQEKLQRLTSKA